MKIIQKKGAAFLAGLFLALGILVSALPCEADISEVLKAKGLLTEEEAAGLKKGDDKKLKGKFKEGFKWETGDKTASFQIGGRVHADVNMFEEQHDKDTSIFLRRARIFAAGKFYENYTWMVEGDFGGGSVAAKDLWVNMNYDPRFQLQAGQFKQPFALEYMTSSRFIDFKERSLITVGVGPERDIGIMLHGLFNEDTLGYQLGVFNGSGPNLSADTEGDKDASMRAWWAPITGLHLGGAFTYGEKSRGLHDFKAQGSGTLVLDFDNKVSAARMELMRFGAEFAYGVGPFRLSSEYMRAEYGDVVVTSDSSVHDFFVEGIYAHGSWFLTGEEKHAKKGKFDRLKPNRNFDLKTGGMGAWELLVGYEWVNVDDGWLDVAKLSGTDETNVYKAGVNWYLNPMFRTMLDYVYHGYNDDIVKRDRGSNDDHEHQVWLRFSLDF